MNQYLSRSHIPIIVGLPEVLGVIPFKTNQYGDLNTFKTAAIMQVVPETGDHAPTTGGNILVVIRISDYVIQVFFSLSGEMWIRALLDRPDREWTTWCKVNTTEIS